MVRIGVVGSISTDFVAEANRRPEQGETVFGASFETSFGGKGANQAVASARLGAETVMFGAVGEDEFAQRLIDNLNNEGIDTGAVQQVSGVPSGSAIITLVEGDNSIIYVAGANDKVKPSDIDKEIVAGLDMVLVQNETPVSTIEHLIDVCHEVQTPIIVNPAPAREMSETYIKKVTYLTPNESEFKMLFPGESLESILKRYPNKLIVTLGSEGAVFFDGTNIQQIPAVDVSDIVDTTGAGDTFNGALAFAVASGLDLVDAVRFANLAGSLSITKKGAQAGMPTLDVLELHEEYYREWKLGGKK
ncbi:ribokinase [Aerococcaceae bacterium DSM 111021]|nr:ribokinase [Aerococcaceae bacterium DSM 111021]